MARYAFESPGYYSDSGNESDSNHATGHNNEVFDAQRQMLAEIQKQKEAGTAWFLNGRRNALINQMEIIETSAIPEHIWLAGIRNDLITAGTALLQDSAPLIGRYPASHAYYGVLDNAYNSYLTEKNAYNTRVLYHNGLVNQYNNYIDSYKLHSTYNQKVSALNAEMSKFNRDAHRHNKSCTNRNNRVSRIKEHLPLVGDNWKYEQVPLFQD